MIRFERVRSDGRLFWHQPDCPELRHPPAHRSAKLIECSLAVAIAGVTYAAELGAEESRPSAKPEAENSLPAVQVRGSRPYYYPAELLAMEVPVVLDFSSWRGGWPMDQSNSYVVTTITPADRDAVPSTVSVLPTGAARSFDRSLRYFASAATFGTARRSQSDLGDRHLVLRDGISINSPLDGSVTIGQLIGGSFRRSEIASSGAGIWGGGALDGAIYLDSGIATSSPANEIYTSGGSRTERVRIVSRTHDQTTYQSFAGEWRKEDVPLESGELRTGGVDAQFGKIFAQTVEVVGSVSGSEQQQYSGDGALSQEGFRHVSLSATASSKDGNLLRVTVFGQEFRDDYSGIPSSHITQTRSVGVSASIRWKLSDTIAPSFNAEARSVRFDGLMVDRLSDISGRSDIRVSEQILRLAGRLGWRPIHALSFSVSGSVEDSAGEQVDIRANEGVSPVGSTSRSISQSPTANFSIGANWSPSPSRTAWISAQRGRRRPEIGKNLSFYLETRADQPPVETSDRIEAGMRAEGRQFSFTATIYHASNTNRTEISNQELSLASADRWTFIARIRTDGIESMWRWRYSSVLELEAQVQVARSAFSRNAFPQGRFEGVDSALLGRGELVVRITSQPLTYELGLVGMAERLRYSDSPQTDSIAGWFLETSFELDRSLSIHLSAENLGWGQAYLRNSAGLETKQTDVEVSLRFTF